MKATHRALIDHLPNMPALIFVCAIGEPLTLTRVAKLAFMDRFCQLLGR